MYAKLLRFDVGFGRPQLAEQIAAETQAAMSRHAGYDSMHLLADYLGGRYMLISYWSDQDRLYDFSYSPEARQLEQTIATWLEGVPFIGTYEVMGSAERTNAERGAWNAV